MNLKSLIMMVVFMAVSAVSVFAQDVTEQTEQLNDVLQSQEGKSTFITAVVIINDKKMIAHTQHDFDVLCAMVQLVDAMKKAKSEKKMDNLQYESEVANLMEKVKKLGVTKIN